MTSTDVKKQDVAIDVPKERLDAFLVQPPRNCCPVCAREHDPKQPHVLDSLYYQLKFNEKHGRMPTEKDAMAHCTKEVKETRQASHGPGVREKEISIQANQC